jgi:hypothetical protein
MTPTRPQVLVKAGYKAAERHYEPNRDEAETALLLAIFRR